MAQLLQDFLEQYNDLLTLDDLVTLARGDSKVAPNWAQPPPANENAWYRLLKDLLANRKRVLPDREKKAWSRGCFGLKLDRIGSLSGLGC
ncbi:C-type natriuretic peptide-like [Amia ocellicauda]|uniref:C-type natriuretic peptide-like n=1 Tax=Amia ocellicauda TaxID=2972642 RepID=UPI003463CC98